MKYRNNATYIYINKREIKKPAAVALKLNQFRTLDNERLHIKNSKFFVKQSS